MASGEQPKEKGRLWTRAFGLVLLIALLCFIICQGLNNGTPIYVAYGGGSNLYAGLLILEFSLAAAAARIFIGRRIDYSSRQRIMLAGALFMLAGSFGAVLIPSLEGHLVYRALQGVGFGLCTTAASTAAADIVPMERLGEGLGYYGLGQSLGMVIGPSLAIVLVSFQYHESLFAGMALLSVLLIAAILACTYEKHPQTLDPDCAYRLALRHQQEVAETPKPAPEKFSLSSLFEAAALPGALPMLVSCFGFSLITNFVSKYGLEEGLANPGLYFVCAAVTMTAVRFCGGRLLDGMRPLALLTVPIACGIASFCLLALTDAPLSFYASGALFGISMGLCFPLYNTVAVRCSPMERRGAATALYLLANDLGIGLGAVIGGEVIDMTGYATSFWGGALMLVAAFVVAAFVFPKGAPDKEGEPHG